MPIPGSASRFLLTMSTRLSFHVPLTIVISFPALVVAYCLSCAVHTSASCAAFSSRSIFATSWA